MENCTPGKADKSELQFPDGLVGDLMEFFLAAAPRPVPEIAWVAAIVFMAGICGQSFNVSGAGLNLYVLLIASTGVGKDAVASGISKLLAAITKSVPAAIEFCGPTHIASAEALLKWLTRSSCIFSIVGEFGLKLKEMASPKVNPLMAALKRVLLDLFNKSGRGNVLGAMAYADNSKNTAVIQSPAFTLFGESTPKFYEDVDEGAIVEGLLPRFMIREYSGPRVALNDAHAKAVPSEALVAKAAELVARCLSFRASHQVCDVEMSPEAKAEFDAYEKSTTAQINHNKANTVTVELQNRSHLKAMKLAAIYAVGCNYISPCISVEQARRAISEIRAQTTSLIAKFSNGQVGAVETNETLRRDMVLKTVLTYATTPFDELPKSYGAIRQLHARRIIPLSYLQKALSNMACFRRAPGGATKALKATIENMRENDELGEIPKRQMVTEFGTNARAYETNNPTTPRSFIPTKPEVFFEH